MIGKYGKGLAKAKGQILVQFPLSVAIEVDILCDFRLPVAFSFTLSVRKCRDFPRRAETDPLYWRSFLFLGRLDRSPKKDKNASTSNEHA